jgi:hypothetical protein
LIVFGPRPPLTSAARQLAADDKSRAAILVVPIGGVTNLGYFIDALGERGLGLALTGLYDAGEERHVLRSLGRCGLGSGLTPAAVQALGFFVCDADLEDELIRALGTAAVEQVIETQGELGSFRRFQVQPFQQAQDHRVQLRRFIGTRAGRKVRYGALLVEALALDRVPRPLDLALARARA